AGPRPAPRRRESPRRRFLDGPRRRRYFGKVPVRAARASAGPLAARAPPHPPPQERAMGLFGLFGKKEEPKKLPPKALPPKLGQLARPPPKGRNNYVIVILDSCRFDSFMAAQPKTMLKLGAVEKRWSYASWTAPSHYNLLMGLVPHKSPPHVFASEYYKEDFLNYNKRFSTDGMEFGKLVPSLFMPTYLRRELGFFTHARVSLPVLNPATCINRDFDSFQLMDKHNDMAAMLPTMKFSEERPSFFMLNVGETH